MRTLASFVALAVLPFASGCASDSDPDDPTVDVGEEPPTEEPPIVEPIPPATPSESIASLLETGRTRGHLVADALMLSTEGMDYRIQLGRGANTFVALHDIELRQLDVATEGVRADFARDYAASRLEMVDDIQIGVDQLIEAYSITLYPTWAVDLLQGQGDEDLHALSGTSAEDIDRKFLELEVTVLARDQIVATALWSITGDSHPFGIHALTYAGAIDQHLTVAIDTLKTHYGSN
jgi:hypothetical protein